VENSGKNGYNHAAAGKERYSKQAGGAEKKLFFKVKSAR